MLEGGRALYNGFGFLLNSNRVKEKGNKTKNEKGKRRRDRNEGRQKEKDRQRYLSEETINGRK